MILKKLLGLIIILIIPQISLCQYQQQLRELISSEASKEDIQEQIDIFFKDNATIITEVELADCYHDVAVHWYYKIRWRQKNDQTALKKAIKYLEKASEIKRKNHDDFYSLKRTLYNIGFFYRTLNQPFDAIDPLTEIITLEGTDKKTLQAHRELAYIFTQIGDFHKALTNINKILNTQVDPTETNKYIVESYIIKADIFSQMGFRENSASIANYLFKADSVLKKSKFDPFVYNYQIDQIEGNRLLEMGQQQKAITHFYRVIDALDSKDSIEIAMVNNSLGQAYFKLGNTSVALKHLNKSTQFDPNYTPAYENLGDLYIADNEFITGLSYYQEAIERTFTKVTSGNYLNMISMEDLELATNKYHLLHHLTQKAKAWKLYYLKSKDLKHLTHALKTYKLADKLVDIIRFESTEYKSKLYWRERSNELYAEAVEVCLWLRKAEETYYFMEKNKAVLLLEDITNEQAKENYGIPPKVAQQEYQLKQMIYLSENQLKQAQSESPDSIRAIKERIYNHKFQYLAFVDSLSNAHPEYAVNKEKINILPYAELKEKYTSSSHAVLQYILGKEKAYGLLTTQDTTIQFTLDELSSIQQNIIDYRKRISKSFHNHQQLEQYNQLSNQLFNQLIPTAVYELITGKTLTIIPDHTLQQVSFETLNTKPKSNSYLIHDAEIKYAYSMTHLHRNNKRKRNPSRSFMGLAPVTFSQDSLSPLSFSINEVTTLSSMLSGDALIKGMASKSNFLDTLNQYSVLHLSTHAGVGAMSEPWVACHDGQLSLNEIYASKNQSDMVVLSACKTSMGALKKGEGVMSIARGFFHSGAKSVVSSLWSVNDKSNQELMINFYDGLQAGMTKSAALRKAKLDYLDTHHGSELSPFYWGGLILIGDNSNVLGKSHRLWVWICLGIGGIILLAITSKYTIGKL